MARRVVLVLFCLLYGSIPSSAQPIEVSVFEGGEGLGFYRRVAEQFGRLNPETPVRLEGDPRIADRLRIRILEGNLPEVTNASINAWSLIEHEELLPLDPWLDGPSWDGSGTWRETFSPGSLDAFTYRGKTYGVPLVYVVWSVYHDKALFQRHGWETPQTWPEFLDLCQQISREAGLAPVAFQGRYPFYAKALVQNTYYQSVGPTAYAAQESLEPGSFHNDAMVETLSWLERLSGTHFLKGSLGMSHTEAQLEFFQGRAAMLFCGSWLFSEMQDNIPEDFELGAFALPLPISKSADPHASYATSGSWFVFKKSANPEAGVQFLRYLTSRQVAGSFASERGITVAVKGANPDLHPLMADVARQLDGVRRTFGSPAGEPIPGMDQVWNDVLGKLMANRVDATEAARELESGAVGVRQRYEEPDRIEVRHLWKSLAFLTFLIGGVILGWRRPGFTRAVTGRVDFGRNLVFLGPALLVYTVFFILPSVVAFFVSLTRWDGLGAPHWVGVANFARLLLESDVFWTALENNVYLMVVIPVVVLPLSLVLASALHHGVWGQRFFRIAFFFPNLLGVAGILLWQQLYNPQGGPINALFTALGMSRFQGFPWLSPDHLYTALIPMGIWGACGFNMVLFLAAMQSIPPDLFEVAELYGASAWEKFRYVTLPMIRETLVAATIFMLIAGMKAFEAIWLLTNQSPTTETHVVGTQMIRSMFIEQRIGQAAAIACLLFAMVLVGSGFVHRLSGGDQAGQS